MQLVFKDGNVGGGGYIDKFQQLKMDEDKSIREIFVYSH